MEDKEIAKVVLARYGVKSDFKGLLAIATDYGVIALAILVNEWIRVSSSSWLFYGTYLVTCFILASRYRGFEILVHEASHNNVFDTRRFNRRLQFLFAYPVFLHVQSYVRIHMAHHQQIGDFENDPDILIYKKWGLDKLPENKLWVLYLRPLALYFTWDYFRGTFANYWRTEADRLSKVAYWATVLALLYYFDAWGIFLMYYAMPFFILLPILRFHARANEHTAVDFNSPDKSARNNLGLFHTFILHPHGDGYHQIHHLYPFVPFYNLPKVHRFLLDNNRKYIDSYNFIHSLRLMEAGCKEPLLKESKRTW
jgi:fatty acid desaturase